MGHNDVAGAIGWCAFDYNTHREFGSGDRICHHGVMDIFRLPKWAAHFYQSQQSPEKGVVLAAATHWTMGDRSGGGNAPLTVFSNCEEIELFIGPTALGRFKPDRQNYPNLKYPPFVVQWSDGRNPWGQLFDDLRIVGYVGEQMVAEQYIACDHVPHCLKLTVDADQLDADGADMARLVVRLTDRYGNTLPYALTVVNLTLEGPAELIGENPLPLIGGQAALYVKSSHAAGPVKITACASDLPPAHATLEVTHR
jgi:beta-galactosidase